VIRALAPVAADRFANAAEFARALVTPETTTPPHVTARSSTAVPQQLRWMATPAFAFGLLVMASTGLYLWQETRHKAPVTDAGPKRLAVLPFANLGDSADAYFADGVAGEIRGKLAAMPALQVIASASSNQYRRTSKSPQQIAHELGVQYLLMGQVQWDKHSGVGDRVRVSPELIEGESGATKWQQPFEAPLTDVFQVQVDIAGRVVESLDLALGTGEKRELANKPTRSFAAYNAYLRGEAISGGMSAFDPPTLRQAAEYYEQAVRLDSTFVLAWARLARARSFIWANGNPDAAEAEAARRAAERAFQLDSISAESRLALGNYYDAVLHQYLRGVGEYAAGLRAAPNNAELLSFAAANEAILGRWDSADVHLQRAETLDPRSATTALIHANILLAERRYVEAARVNDRALALAPTNPVGIGLAVFARVGQGDLRGAQALVRAASKEVDESTLVASVANWVGPWVLSEAQQQLLLRLRPSHFDNDRAGWGGALAGAYWLRGDRTRARVYADSARLALSQQLQEDPQNAGRHAGLGLMLAYLGHDREAIREADRAVALTPTSKDALNGPPLVYMQAGTYVVAGQSDRAVERLEWLLGVPSALSSAWLKIDPTFAPLRGNPRFERLVDGR
jgi:TolB-like protein/Flp pilus assembly protein TadD